jgi:transposase
MKKELPKQGIRKVGTGLPVIHAHAAGIDIGDTFHCIAIPDGQGGQEVKTITAYSCDLREIVLYLKSNGIQTVAMESTGVYWVMLYLLLEEAGLDPYLVNARDVKNVTGRKKDDTDAMWIQKLHTCGLLRKCYQPEGSQRILRSYTRQRETLLQSGADAMRRIQKSLELMNVKLHTDISDIVGKTGMAMVRAILGGERNPETLYALRDHRIKASKETLLKSLDGIWSEDCLFSLKQAVQTYDFHQAQLKECEAQIQIHLQQQIATVRSADLTERSVASLFEKKGKAKARKNQFSVPLIPALAVLAGVDLTQIPGISEVTALTFLAEVGLDLSLWKSPKHFAAWLNLVPNVKQSGGRILSQRMMRKRNKAGQILRMAAASLCNSKSPLGDFYRRMKSKLGPKGAVVATAHKIARIIYKMMTTKSAYNDQQLKNEQAALQQHQILKLEKKLAALKAKAAA